MPLVPRGGARALRVCGYSLAVLPTSSAYFFSAVRPGYAWRLLACHRPVSDLTHRPGRSGFHRLARQQRNDYVFVRLTELVHASPLLPPHPSLASHPHCVNCNPFFHSSLSPFCIYVDTAPTPATLLGSLHAITGVHRTCLHALATLSLRYQPPHSHPPNYRVEACISIHRRDGSCHIFWQLIPSAVAVEVTTAIARSSCTNARPRRRVAAVRQ